MEISLYEDINSGGMIIVAASTNAARHESHSPAPASQEPTPPSRSPMGILLPAQTPPTSETPNTAPAQSANWSPFGGGTPFSFSDREAAPARGIIVRRRREST